MLRGDLGAAVELDVMIGDGITVGGTRFVRVTERARRIYGRVHPSEIVKGEFAAVTPKRMVVLFGVKDRRDPATNTWRKAGYLSRYKIGDAAVYDSFNLVYIGRIKSIGASRIAIVDDGKVHSLDLAKFSRKNWDPATIEKSLKRNQEWMD